MLIKIWRKKLHEFDSDAINSYITEVGDDAADSEDDVDDGEQHHHATTSSPPGEGGLNISLSFLDDWYSKGFWKNGLCLEDNYVVHLDELYVRVLLDSCYRQLKCNCNVYVHYFLAKLKFGDVSLVLGVCMAKIIVTYSKDDMMKDNFLLCMVYCQYPFFFFRK